MEPVRIKYYGLVWLTKTGYLIGTLIAGSFVIILLLMMYPAFLPPFRWPWEPVHPTRLTGVAGWLYNHFYDICLFLLLAELVDVVVTLRCFARKEAERRASAPGREPTSTP